MKREKFWAECGRINFSSTAQSSENYIKSKLQLFENKKIMEIGPGMGRQLNVVNSVNYKEYCIADITSSNFEETIFKNCDNLIISYPDYTETNNKKYDVVHCWFVVHHVLPDELDNFFNFVRKHLKKNGHFIFNFPCKERHYNNQSNANDGIKTAEHTKEKVLEKLTGFDIVDDGEYFGDYNSYCITAKKK